MWHVINWALETSLKEQRGNWVEVEVSLTVVQKWVPQPPGVSLTFSLSILKHRKNKLQSTAMLVPLWGRALAWCFLLKLFLWRFMPWQEREQEMEIIFTIIMHHANMYSITDKWQPIVTSPTGLWTAVLKHWVWPAPSFLKQEVTIFGGTDWETKVWASLTFLPNDGTR